MNSLLKLIFASAMLAPFFVSCSSDGNDEANVGKVENKSLKLNYSISAPEVKSPVLDSAGAGSFSADDMLSLVFFAAPDKYIRKDIAASAKVLKWADLGLPVTTEDVTVSGCYPVPAVQGQEMDFDVSSQSEDCDLLLAPFNKVKYGYESTVNMQFRHSMHLLKVEFFSEDKSVSDEELKNANSSLLALTKCKIDLIKGEVNEALAESAGEYAAKKGKSISFYVVPQANNDIRLKVNIAGKVKELPLPKTTNTGNEVSRLEGGVCLTLCYNVTKKDDQTNIVIAGTDIAGWEDAGSADGSVEF